MTRRRLLQALLAALSTLGVLGRQVHGALRAAITWLVLGLVPAAESEPLAADDLLALVSFAEVLVDSRLLSTDTRRGLVEHLTDSAREDAKQRALYRGAGQFLDRLAGGAFAGLTLPERVALIRRHRLDVRRLTAEERDGAISKDEHDIRTRIVPELIAACWRSPAGWDVVGYTAFPGRCGDLTRYTRPDP